MEVGVFLVNFRRGSLRSLKFGMNFAQYVAMPRKLRMSFTECGKGAFFTASTFAGSAEIHSLEKIMPKNLTLF